MCCFVYMLKLSVVISCFIYSPLDWLCSLFNICFSLWLHKKQGKVGIQNEKRERATKRERSRGMCRFYLLLLITAKKHYRVFFFYIHFSFLLCEKKSNNNHWLFDSIYSNAANKFFTSIYIFSLFHMMETNEVSRDNILT